MNEFNKAEWKRERFHLSEDKSLFGKPLGRGFNGRLKQNHDKPKKYFVLFEDEKQFLEKYQQFLELSLERVRRALRKFN